MEEDEEVYEVVEEGARDPFLVPDSFRSSPPVDEAAMDVSNDSSDDESDDDAVQSSVPTTTVPAQASHVARLVVPGPDGSTLIDTTVESRISRDRKRKHERIPEEELQRKRKKSARDKILRLINKKGLAASKSRAVAAESKFGGHTLSATAERTFYLVFLITI